MRHRPKRPGIPVIQKEDATDLTITGREVIDVTEAEFSKDEKTGKMTASMVLIKAGRAKNPRNYRASALQKAVTEGTYDNLRMFVNHSDKPPIKRGFDEMVSAVESTTWDPTIKPLGGIKAQVEFFNEDFFEKAQKARQYIGVSADHTIGIKRVREGQQLIEDVHEIVNARSVDWVLYPSAGGEIIQFARESEGDEEVDWDKVTLEDLKKNAPKLVEELAKESGPEDDDEEGTTDGDEKFVPRSEIAKLVKEQVEEIQKVATADAAKAATVAKSVKDYVSKSGLPTRTQARVISQFAGKTEYVETDVKEAVEDAKAELKEAGAKGPQITGMGNSSSETETPATVRVGARESVENFFMGPKKGSKEKEETKA